MNNHIEKLLTRALDQAVPETWTRLTHEQTMRLSSTLAELIVRECVQVCEPILDEPYEDMTEFGKGLVEGQDVAIERIKEHFGVEE